MPWPEAQLDPQPFWTYFTYHVALVAVGRALLPAARVHTCLSSTKHPGLWEYAPGGGFSYSSQAQSQFVKSLGV